MSFSKRNNPRLLPILLFAVLLPAVFAAEVPTAFALEPPQKAAAQSFAAQPAAAQSPATAYTLPPGKLAKATALYRVSQGMWLAELVYGLAVLFLLCRWGVGARLRGLAEKVSSRRFVQALIFVPLLLLGLDLLSLPFDLFGHFLGLKYGLSVQGWESWFLDWAKGELIGLPMLALLGWGFYEIVRRSPRRWWLWSWLLSAPLAVALVFLAPILLDPVFHHFEPLSRTQPELVERIEGLAKRAGVEIPRERIFLMKASEKVTTYNAYVTGLGASKRIVIWDNTVRELPPAEVSFIVGHEMGHYALHHVWQGIAVMLAFSFFGFWLAWRLAERTLARWGERWRIRRLDDWASLPMLLLLASLLSVAGEPLGNAYSRHIEHQADIYGLEVTHGLTANSSQAAADSFQRMGENSLSYPWPNRVLVFWRYTHPPVADRLRFALEYRPWEKGQAPRFVR